MSDALYSPLWHEVAALRPALRATVHCRRMSARGEAWQLLSAPESRQQLRINAAAWRLVGCLDGTRSLDALWHALVERFGDAAPSQPEVIDLLGQLSAAGFLRADVLPDLPAQFDAASARERQRRRAALSPLAMRVRLFDPGPLLDALLPYCRALFSPLALALWVAAVLVTALVALSEASALAVAIAEGTRSPRFVLIAWIVYPLMKAVHELAHGLAIRHWGGRVANAGFTLLVLVPVPYVDASAANAFARPRRIAVSAAGVMCELIIAAAAFWLWLA
ncbi:MAG: PqqD family protein, partial [Rhodocyclaceae bacterium]|nr:PqqD family protein [Rhodocyclaceae bacterium]